MAELADALDLGSSVNRREGSSPFTRTIIGAKFALFRLFLTKISHPSASLLFPFREKSRSIRLLVCKRTCDGSLSLPTSREIASSAQPKSHAAIMFTAKSCKNTCTNLGANFDTYCIKIGAQVFTFSEDHSYIFHSNNNKIEFLFDFTN